MVLQKTIGVSEIQIMNMTRLNIQHIHYSTNLNPLNACFLTVKFSPDFQHHNRKQNIDDRKKFAQSVQL